MEIINDSNPKRSKRLIYLAVSGFFLWCIFSIFEGCIGCPYSFSGASVPPHLKTIAIPYAEDKSGMVEPGLREKLTELLTKKFIDDNNLKITERAHTDITLETVITAITDVPAVVAAGEKVASRRLTITVQAVCKDLVKKKVMYDKSFSFYADYASSDGKTGRDAALGKAIDRISDDIVLETVSGW